VAVSFALSSLVAFLSALCYTEFAADVPLAGGAYVYVALTFGEFAAWIAGANLMLEYTLSAAAVGRGWTSYLAESVLLDPDTFRLPLGPLMLDLPAAAIVLALSALLSRGIREGSRFNIAVTAANLASIAVVLGAGFAATEPANYVPFAPNGWRAISTAASVVFFSFIGFDTVASTAEEVRQPARDLPIGILLSLAICTVLYVLMALALTGMLPWEEIDVHAPFGAVFDTLGQGWVAVLVSVGALTGITTSLLVSLIGQARVYVTLARDGLIPPALAAIHPVHGTPARAQMVTGALSALLALCVDIEVLAKLVNIGTLFVFFMVATGTYVRRYVPSAPGPTRDAAARAVDWRLAAVMLPAFGFSMLANAGAAWWALLLMVVLAAAAAATFLSLPVAYAPPGFRVPLMPFTPAAAMGGTLWLIGSLGIWAFARFFVWMALSVAVYLAYGMHRSASLAAANAAAAAREGDAPPRSGSDAIAPRDVQLSVVNNPLAAAQGPSRGGSVSGSPPLSPGSEPHSEAEDIALHRGPDSAAVR